MAMQAWTPVDETASLWKPVEGAPVSGGKTEGRNVPKNIWERLGIVPSEEDLGRTPLAPGEQAGPAIEGGPGEMLHTGLSAGTRELASQYVKRGPGQVISGAGEVAKGNIAKGGHQIISGGMTTLLPLAPEAIVANPIMAARAVGGGLIGSKVAEAGSKALGANEEQQQFAGDVGGLAAGFAAASGLPRALFETAAKRAMSKVATSVSGSLDPDIVGLISPRLAHLMRIAGKVAEVTKSPIEGTASGPVPSGEVPAAEPKLPNATYLRPDMKSLSQRPPAAKPDLLQGIREHEFLMKVQDELNRQGGDEQAQAEIDKWIADHNKQTPGGKPKNPAQAAFEKAKGQGGHAGGGVSSVEELNRPGSNYVVSQSGKLTYHGKAFDPGGIPSGSTHVTALPDGTLRVNAGPKLNPVQEMALKAALPKPAAGVPRVPTSDAELEDLLMQSLKQARAKRAGAD